MQRAHKIKLDPTVAQTQYFAQACGIARFTWNWALDEWQRQYQAGEKPTGFCLKKQFNAIKREQFPWMYDVTKYASQQPFIYLQKAFNRFFHKTAHYPKFKRKGVKDRFYIGNDHIEVKDKRIRIPKLGWVRMREFLRYSGRILSATISRIANQWFVSLQVELEDHPSACESQACAGIDLGIKQLATIYDGISADIVVGPKPLNSLLKKLRREQKRLSRKGKRSKNRAKQRNRVALLYFRIRNIRQDALHKLTTKITRDYQRVAIEDLHVSGMLANAKLARHIADMGFYEFRRQLTYKAESQGNEIHVMDRWFPSSKRCSACHEIDADLTLSNRQFHCQHCGFDEDRDINAAINLFSTVSFTGY